jgi:hypothetical protein
MNASATARLCRATPLLALLVLAACGDGGEASKGPDTGVAVVGTKPGMTHTEFMAMPDSIRLGSEAESGAFGTERGVGVEVDVSLNGMQGKDVPLAYSLHDARNDVHFVSQTIRMTSAAPSWRKKGYVWLPVPSPGTYYVRVVLADSTGHGTEGPRTQDFTLQ